jgi:hypothetical protein
MLNDHHFFDTRDESIHALVIYDTFALAVDALQALQRAARCGESRARWNITPWRMDVLRLPLAREEALRNAASADLLLLAGPEACALPHGLRAWLEAWADSRQVRDAGVAAMVDKHHGLMARTTPQLVSFCRQHGLDFITADHGPSREAVFSTGEDFPRPSPVFVATPARMAYGSYRNWGIND